MEVQMGYRVVEVKNGKVMSLFHGTNGSRQIHLDQWNKAEIKIVGDGKRGSSDYLSGWHFLKSREVLQEGFDKYFKVKENRYIVPCCVRGNIRPKRSTGRGFGSYLADEILIRSEDINRREEIWRVSKP